MMGHLKSQWIGLVSGPIGTGNPGSYPQKMGFVWILS